jgi:hypothetical protein
MTPGMTPNGILLDVIVLPKKNVQKRYNKHLTIILIRLIKGKLID